MNMESLKRPDTFIVFKGSNEFFDFLHELEKTDIWKTVNLRHVVLSADTDGNYKMFTGDDTVDVNQCAHYTLKRRAKNNADILYDMPPTVAAECLNMSWPYVPKPDALALIRGEQILAVHSGEYAIITQKQVFESFNEYLETSFDEPTFTNASYSHELTKATYQVEDRSFYDNIVEAFNECGFPVSPEDVTVTVDISTSDTGNSCVTILPYLKIGEQPRFPFAKPLKVMHKGNVDKRLEMLNENYEKMLSLLCDGVENLKRLYSIEIKKPYECAENICKKVAIPVNMVRELQERLDGFGSLTAGDIYVTLCEIIFSESFMERSVRGKLQIQDGLSKILYLSENDWKRYDR